MFGLQYSIHDVRFSGFSASGAGLGTRGSKALRA